MAGGVEVAAVASRWKSDANATEPIPMPAEPKSCRRVTR